MTTAQESPNGHLPQKGYPQDALFAGNKVPPPPGSAGNPAELNSADLPTDKDHNKPFPASAYHVPPEIYVPEARAYREGEPRNRPHLPGPLPGRCQFMFSDGRQCTMARSDIHPTLCVYHSEREEQLFGDPSALSIIRGRTYDLPELFSAARNLSTASSVNRVLAQVFRLLAQRRISRQEAATFAHLAKLLLRTISLMEAQSLGVAESDDVSGGVILSERSERRISPQSSTEQKCPPSRSNQATAPSPSPTPVNSSIPPIAPGPPINRAAMANSPRISTSAPSSCNSTEFKISKNIELDPIQNQHLHGTRWEGNTEPVLSSGKSTW